MSLQELTSFVRRFRFSLGVASLFLAAALVAPSAQADPHAVFYTAVGQQQLFFNTLAALDQADYVESAKLRDELLTKREGITDPQTGQRIGLSREKSPIANATQTNLASILSRPVTLEGNDLWTSFLLHQDALEKQRRKDVDERERRLCQLGLGVVGCRPGGERPGTAFISNTESWNDATNQAAIAALESGEDDAEREKIKKTRFPKAEDYRPYNEMIADIRNSAPGGFAKREFEERVDDVREIFEEDNSPASVVIKNTEIRSDGTLLVGGKEGELEDYLLAVQTGISLGSDVLAAATAGAEEQAAFASVAAQSGVLGQLVSSKELNRKGELDISSPAEVRAGAIYEAHALAALEAATIQHVPLESIHTPEQNKIDPLLQTGNGAANPRPGQPVTAAVSNQVAGIQDTQALQNDSQGKVAGLSNIVLSLLQLYSYYDQPLTRQDPAQPIQSSNSDDAIVDWDRISSAGEFSEEPKQCGFCVQSQSLISRIREVVEAGCDWFNNLCPAK